MTMPSRPSLGKTFERQKEVNRIMEELRKQRFGKPPRTLALEEMFSEGEIRDLAKTIDQRTGETLAETHRAGGNALTEASFENVFLQTFHEFSSSFNKIAEWELKNDDLDSWKQAILSHEQREKKGGYNLITDAQMDQQYRVTTQSNLPIKLRKEIARAEATGFVSSAWGGSDADIDRVMNLGPAPELLPESVSPFKRNAIFDAKGKALDNLAVARAELTANLNGRELTEAEKKKIRRSPTRFNGAFRNLGETLAYGLNEAVVKSFTRGILTHTDPKETEIFNWYENRRRKMLSTVSHEIANAKESKNLLYLNALEKMYTDLAKQDEYKHLWPQILQIQKEIEQQKKVLEGINEQEAKKLSDEIDKLNDEMFGKAKDLAAEDDSMVKWRIFQVVLIASPFGLFNFMVPIVNIFGPLFSATGTFGEGMASIVTSDVWGPFGQLAGMIEMDTVIQFTFDKVPLISDLGGLLKDIIAAGPTQELFGLMGPTMTGDPMIPLFIALGFSLSRGKSEVEHYDKERDAKKAMGKKLDKEFGKYDKESVSQARASMRKFLEDSVEKSTKLRLYSQQIADLVSFIAENCYTDEGREALKIFDDMKVKCQIDGEEEEEYTLFELSQKVDFRDDENTARFLNLLPKQDKTGKEDGGLSARQEMMTRIAVFNEIAEESLITYQSFGADRVKSEGEKLIKNKLDEIAIEVAKEKGIVPVSGSDSSLEAKAKSCKEGIVISELDKWERFRKIASPGKAVEEPEAANCRAELTRLGTNFASDGRVIA
jgi:hypothetical protein